MTSERSPTPSLPADLAYPPTGLRTPDKLEEIWQGFCADFRKMSVTGLNPDAGKATLKSYGSLSTDHVTLNARFSPLWIATSHRLLDLTEDEIEFLYTLAEENCDLLELHVKRKVGLYFFVYPAIISGIFNLPQVAEAIKLSTGESVNIFTIYAIVFGIGGLLFMNFYGAKWKATELASCIKVGLARAKLLNAQRESAAT